MSETQSKPHISFILLIGSLSIFFAEIFAGSTKIWFFDTWALTVTYWLYLGHLLFFLNIAFRTGRTSIPQLYLWGCMFGLYESWITKVLWTGYPGSTGPAMGLFFGIAIFEYFTLVFFWHPVLAFVIPVIMYEWLSGQNIIPSHASAMTRSKHNKITMIVLVFLGSNFISMNYQFDIMIILIVIGGTLLIIGILYKLSKTEKNKADFSIQALKFGNKGFILVCIYVISLNVVTWFILNPQNIPKDSVPFLFIIVSYLVFGMLLKISPKNPVVISNNNSSGPDESIANIKDFFIYILLFLGLAIGFSLLQNLIFITIIFVGLGFCAPVIFVIMVVKLLKLKKSE